MPASRRQSIPTVNLFLIGFISILGQVVILRELNVAFFGIELIYILAIGIWLLGTAAGAGVGHFIREPKALHLTILFLFFSLLLPLDVAAIRAVRPIFSDVPGAYLPFDRQMTAMLLTVMPISFVLGVQFQWAARHYLTPERTLAVAYAIESGGGLLGGLASVLFLKFNMSNFSQALLGSFVVLAVIHLQAPKPHARRLRSVATFFMVLIALLLIMSRPIDEAMTRWTHPHLLTSADTPYGRVTLTELQQQVAVFENDALAFETQGTSAEEFTHLAVLQRPAPNAVLLLGGGVDGSLQELLKYPDLSVDYVEINHHLLHLARQHLTAAMTAPLDDERVRIHIADPRRFLESAGTYDRILVAMPEPASAQANRYYTREFFAQCAAHLKPDGILAFRLNATANVWTAHFSRQLSSIHDAHDSVFSDTAVLPGSSLILLASNQPLTRDPDILQERWRAYTLATRLVSEPYINYLYTNDRFHEIATLLQNADAPPNTDLRPICYQFTLMIWLSKFFPKMTQLDWLQLDNLVKRYDNYLIWVFLFLLISMIISRRWPLLRRTFLVGLTGLIGMFFETVLVLHYQMQSGILFQNIGFLLTMFMAGLSLGSLLVHSLSKLDERTWNISRFYGAALLADFVILVLLFANFAESAFFAHLAGTALAMVLTGAFVAGIFAYASLSRVETQEVLVAPLYAADLVGGCIGSLLASLLLIPFLGMAITAHLIAALTVVALILL